MVNNLLKIFLLCFFILSKALAYELPDLGEHSATIFTAKQEEMLGKLFFQEVKRSTPIVTDPIINEYIQTLGNKLASVSGSKRRSFHFFVVSDPDINSFAGPDGYIGINSGMILISRSESELAAVMAHEIAHVTQHHIERLYEQANSTELPALATMAAAVLVGATAHSNSLGSAATGAAMATMAGSEQHAINFTRDEEREADHIGMKILTKAGFDPKAMAATFQHVQRLTYDYQKDYPDYLSDHPVSNERIADASARSVSLPKTTFKSSNTFYLIRARTQVLQARESFRAVNYFKTLLNNPKQTHKDAIKYGYSLALASDQQYSAAQSAINSLLQNSSNEVIYQLAAAQIQQSEHNYPVAINILKQALNSHPNYYPLILQYGSTLIANNQTAEAARFLRNKSIDFPDKIGIYVLLADAQAKTKHIADAYQSRAMAYELDGYNRQAILLLQQAQKVPNLSFNDKAVIAARIQRLQKLERSST